MKVLITGNMGYIGPVLTTHIRAKVPEAELIGYDAGFFAHCLTGAERLPEAGVKIQHFGDVRNFPSILMEGVDAVVHLAAVSNDPMGGRFEAVTADINHKATIEIARAAQAGGVKHFVFASSCSMYGAAEGGPRCEDHLLNPLTAYARSKVASEGELSKLADDGMVVTSLRFSTACGMSDRIRLDLVLNDFVACAIANKEITVLSDGTPWRPLIDVQDMSRAIEWGIKRSADKGGAYLAVNVGCREQNYQVRDLAEAVASAIPGTKISVNTNAPPDKRSYKVDFSLYEKLAPTHQPQVSLGQSIQEIRDGLEGLMFRDTNFRNSQFMRLKVLERHIAERRLSEGLFWIGG